MTQAGYAPVRRFEYGWVLAGLCWGALVGCVAMVLQFASLVQFSTGAETSGGGPDAAVPWLIYLLVGAATYGGMYGGVVGMVVGVVVMLAVGQDPEQRVARRTPATVALLATPLLLWVVWRFL